MKGTREDPLYVHATAVVIGDVGLLISGRSRAGKSHLAEALIAQGIAHGWPSLLVGDDRVGLVAEDRHILVLPHPAIAGLIERRGTGILPVPHQREAQLLLEIALDPAGPAEPARDAVERLPGLFLDRIRTGEQPQAQFLFPLVVAALTT